MSDGNLNDISKVSYQGVSDVISAMEKIGNANVEIGKNFEKVIDSFKSDKALSSKVITPSMESMIDSINSLNVEFKDRIDRYCEFLRQDVNQGYYNSDENIEGVWDNLKELFDKAKE